MLRCTVPAFPHVAMEERTRLDLVRSLLLQHHAETWNLFLNSTCEERSPGSLNPR
jgi:hypothetical protein